MARHGVCPGGSGYLLATSLRRLQCATGLLLAQSERAIHTRTSWLAAIAISAPFRAATRHPATAAPWRPNRWWACAHARKLPAAIRSLLEHGLPAALQHFGGECSAFGEGAETGPPGISPASAQASMPVAGDARP
jgi:hypothetical protein